MILRTIKYNITSKVSLKYPVVKQFEKKSIYNFVYTYKLIFCLSSSDTLQVFLFVSPTI